MKDLIERASKIKIIFFDIDDTLRDLKTGYIPESLPFIFETLRQKGIKTGIATGRNYYNVLPEIRNLNPDFFVTINGALVQNQAQEIIYKNPLDKETVDEIVTWLKSEGAEYLFVGNENLKASKWEGLTEQVIPGDYGILEVKPDYYKDRGAPAVKTTVESINVAINFFFINFKFTSLCFLIRTLLLYHKTFYFYYKNTLLDYTIVTPCFSNVIYF